MRVGFAARALAELAELEEVLSLPADTRIRVREALRTLEVFAHAGRALEDEWEPYRIWSGPWPWMLFIYEVLEDERCLAELERVGGLERFDRSLIPRLEWLAEPVEGEPDRSPASRDARGARPEPGAT